MRAGREQGHYSRTFCDTLAGSVAVPHCRSVSLSLSHHVAPRATAMARQSPRRRTRTPAPDGGPRTPTPFSRHIVSGYGRRCHLPIAASSWTLITDSPRPTPLQPRAKPNRAEPSRAKSCRARDASRRVSPCLAWPAEVRRSLTSCRPRRSDASSRGRCGWRPLHRTSRAPLRR